MHANAGRDVGALVAEGLTPGRALMLAQTDPKAVEMMVNGTAYQDWQVEALLSRVTCPVAFIHGDKETGSHVYEGEPERAMRLVRVSLIVRIPGSGHAASLTHPEEFRSEVQGAIEWIMNEATP
jgi:pimeloyl-ACP methyl ester carboxylesterase